MIPTLLLFGIVFGHWWRAALIVATLGWPVLLLTTSNDSFSVADLVTAAGLALVNAGLGVALHQAVRYLLRRKRS